MLSIDRLNTQSDDFERRLVAATDWQMVANIEHEQKVASIIEKVRDEGDQALVSMTRAFDRWPDFKQSDIQLSAERIATAKDRVPAEQLRALDVAAERIAQYHMQQKASDWQFEDDLGNRLGQRITPLDRVGVYVPGGKAAYPSSVLMNIIPAVVAGVDHVAMVVPMPEGEINDLVLAAADLAGATHVFAVGGAQAIAALAYGTETIAAVDKITGPGNAYVASAKRQVFGRVGIDMIAGPSEICVVCDGKTPIDWVVYDLFSQAEHDEDAQAILISTDAEYLDAVAARMQVLLPTMPRRAVIEASLSRRAVFIEASTLGDAAEAVNLIAPEHLELSLDDAEGFASRVRHAGAIFMGRYAAEALGDYCAGPNHVLPTSRSARFFSPLGVYDFQKRSSTICCSEQGAHVLGEVASVLAEAEGLQAHAQSALARVRGE